MPDAPAPFYLSGHATPVPDETDARDLAVTGALPPELDGRFLRNGPNPLPGEDPGHWFFGHGMVHGIRLRDGRAEWYRNRWVRTEQLAGRQMMQPDGTFDRRVGSANTSLVVHDGRIFALVESSFPYEITADLDTVGPCDFDGRLTTAMTAHPKRDPATGDLHFFGYGFLPPYLTYHRLSADGELVTSAEIDVPGATMNHDFAITEHHAVFLDLPMTFQLGLLASGMPFGFDESYGARIGVMPFAEPGRVTWFDVDPGYVFHVGNAHEDAAGRIVLEAPRFAPADAIAMWSGVSGPATAPEPLAPKLAAAAASGDPRLHRWTLDPATGTATEEALDDRGVEFPTLDDELTGRRSRYLYTRADSGDDVAIVKYDLVGGTSTEHALPADVVPGEAVFVPSTDPGRGEDDGWLLTLVTARGGGPSRLLVLDATDLPAGPVAEVHLPRRVPVGFHAAWVPEDAVSDR